MKINKTMLLEIAQDLLDYNKKMQFGMGSWASILDASEPNYCGTQFCIGGNAMFRSGFRPFKLPIGDIVVFLKPHATASRAIVAESRLLDEGKWVDEERSDKLPWTYDEEGTAAKILRLTRGQANRLFYVTNWDEPFREMYKEAVEVEDQERARMIGAAYIHHFVANNA